MADNSRKTPLAATLNRFADKKITDALQLTGKALPCSVVSSVVTGAIVTVKFELNSAFTLPNVTVPVAGSVYVRVPLQPGDKGVVIAADARLGGISGLGAGIANLTTPGNLSALVFVPIGNSAWSAIAANVLLLQGPQGVTIQDMSAASKIELTPTSITLSVGGHSIVINSSGVHIDGKIFLTHEHTGVTVGSGVTGGVV